MIQFMAYGTNYDYFFRTRTKMRSFSGWDDESEHYAAATGKKDQKMGGFFIRSIGMGG